MANTPATRDLAANLFHKRHKPAVAPTAQGVRCTAGGVDRTMAGRGCRQRRPPPPAVLCLAALLAAAFAPCAAQVTTADYQALGQGVGTLDTSAIYGSRLLLYGNAMAIAADGPNTIVAATVHGSGRAVHFGHEGMFGQCCGSTGVIRVQTVSRDATMGGRCPGRDTARALPVAWQRR